MEHVIRQYDKARDLDHILRSWLEIGWLESADKQPALEAFLESSSVEVAELDGEAEAMTMWTPSVVRYQDTDLPMSAITAVTVSHVGRKLGLASTLTARSLKHAADAGMAVAALGMFDQGFYDRFGFGTGSYTSDLTFDPATLQLDHVPYRRPVRLGVDDYAEIARAVHRRMPSHGAMTLLPELVMKGEMLFTSRPFNLGYRNDDGELTHCVLGSMTGEHGPFRVNAIVYQTTAQLLQLLRMLKELGDQVRSIWIIEPAHIQLQALLSEPMRERDRTTGSAHQSQHRSKAWWQFRMLDLGACVAARRWPGEPVPFNLTLSDPAVGHVDGWDGVAGDYTITVGQSSSASVGHTNGLPLMSTDVGSFTRMWFGVRSPTTLTATDPIDAPPSLISALDEALLMPEPHPGWMF